MSQDNPFAPPRPPASRQSPTVPSWVEGDLLVTRPAAELPLICARCGTRDDVQLVQVRGQWSPLWVRFLVVVSPALFIVAHMFTMKRYNVWFGLCPSHRTRRTLGLYSGASLMVSGVGAMFGGLLAQDPDVIYLSLACGFWLVLIGVLVLMVLMSPVQIVRVTDERAEFRGAHPHLLHAVRSGPDSSEP